MRPFASRLSLTAGSLVLLAAGTAFTRSHPATRPATSSFDAVIDGAVTGMPAGRVALGTARPFSLVLDAGSGDGAIMFTSPRAGHLQAGSYPITDGPGAESVRALVVTGSVERPTGSFRADRGTLTITESSDSLIAGRFELSASGFLANDPTDESQVVTARGSFRAPR